MPVIATNQLAHAFWWAGVGGLLGGAGALFVCRGDRSPLWFAFTFGSAVLYAFCASLAWRSR